MAQIAQIWIFKVEEGRQDTHTHRYKETLSETHTHANIETQTHTIVLLLVHTLHSRYVLFIRKLCSWSYLLQ